MKPGDKRKHNDMIHTFLGMNEKHNMTFQNNETKEIQVLTPSQLDISFIELDN